MAGNEIIRPADSGPPELLFTDRLLKRHEGLSKARSSLLVQARTGDIGLREFLFRRKVPGVATPLCQCGQGRETVEHLAVWCPDPPRPRPWEPDIRSRRDLHAALQGVGPNRRLAGMVVRWLMSSGRLPEYSLALRLELETAE